jgi:hypothetical protein
LLTAHTQDPPVPWVEVGEDGVLSPDLVLESAGTQRIAYREEDQPGCLVKIAQALRRFQDLTNLTTIRLGPKSAVEQIRPLLDDPSFACTCHSLGGGVQAAPRPTPVFPIRGSLFIQLRGIARGELVRIVGYYRCTSEGIVVALSIQQSQKYEGNDFWRWSVWIGGSPEELGSIDHVLYILDPTFHNPVRTVSDRTTNFRLDESTWGAFTMYAKIMHLDGHETPLKHDLVLLYPDGRPTFA